MHASVINKLKYISYAASVDMGEWGLEAVRRSSCRRNNQPCAANKQGSVVSLEYVENQRSVGVALDQERRGH